jgi:adenine-specific DNA glycosylase
MVCTPRAPLCDGCPLATDCVAKARGITADLPVKSKKLARKMIWHHFYLIGVDEGRLWVQRRPATGLWPNLWEIPNEAVAETDWNNGNLEGYALLGAFKHVFTHQDMMIKVYAGETLPETMVDKVETLRLIPLADIGNHAFSRAVLKIFERYLQRNAYFPVQ